MAMNKKFAKMHKDKRAEMGVGTMIIFIAMVLVAAVAASVLISSANTVREQAVQTGNDAIRNVASGFDIKYVKGNVAENKINQMDIFVQLYAGSPALSLGDVTLSITAGGKSGELTFDVNSKTAAAGTPAQPAVPEVPADPEAEPPVEYQPAVPAQPAQPALYGATLVPPAADNSVFAKYGTVAQGDLVKITIKFINEDSLEIKPGDKVNIKIMPANGMAAPVSFTVPSVLYDGPVDLRN